MSPCFNVLLRNLFLVECFPFFGRKFYVRLFIDPLRPNVALIFHLYSFFFLLVYFVFYYRRHSRKCQRFLEYFFGTVSSSIYVYRCTWIHLPSLRILKYLERYDKQT